MGFAIAKLGMSERDYCFSTPRAFYNAMRIWFKFYENDTKHAYIRARRIAYSAVSPYLPKSTFEFTFWPFPWDKIGIKDMLSRVVIPDGKNLESIKKLHEKFNKELKPGDIAQIRAMHPKKDIKGHAKS